MIVGGGLQSIMPKRLIDKVIDELKEVDYAGLISLNLYNEPLLDSELENNISYMKTNLPNSFVSFNSNGDYLTIDRLFKLDESGLDEIRVTLHTENYQDKNRRKAIDTFFKKLNLNYKVNKFVSNEMIMVEKKFNNLNLIVMCTNWNKIGNDRAGTVELNNKKVIRNKPCMKPFREIVISTEGNCYPCCNFFPNSDISKQFLIGNISKKSIYDVFSSEIMVNFRKNLFDFSPKIRPCNTCNDLDNSTLNTDFRRKEILNNILIQG